MEDGTTPAAAEETKTTVIENIKALAVLVADMKRYRHLNERTCVDLVQIGFTLAEQSRQRQQMAMPPMPGDDMPETPEVPGDEIQQIPLAVAPEPDNA